MRVRTLPVLLALGAVSATAVLGLPVLLWRGPGERPLASASRTTASEARFHDFAVAVTVSASRCVPGQEVTATLEVRNLTGKRLSWRGELPFETAGDDGPFTRLRGAGTSPPGTEMSGVLPPGKALRETFRFVATPAEDAVRIRAGFSGTLGGKAREGYAPEIAVRVGAP